MRRAYGMQLGRFALASVLLGWNGGASASPLLAMHAGISVKSQNSVEAVRWRHRHRSYSWDKADDTESASRRAFGENRSPTDVVMPDLGRRYHRSRSWSGRAAASGDETDGVVLGSDRANRFTRSDMARPDLHRRRGWIDPPPTQ